MHGAAVPAPTSTFRAVCAATVPFNGATMFLLRLEPPDERRSHLSGDLPKAVLELEPGATYEVTFRKVEPVPGAG